jgi:hypothetical protein
VEALVSGTATAQAIYDQLLLSVAAGIRTHGDEVGASVDAEGVSQVMKYSIPDEIEIYVEITLTYDADLYPADGDDQVKAAIIAFRATKNTGDDAVSSSTAAQAFKVSGVNDVVSCFIDDAAAPTVPTTVAIALREIAVFDTARIDVISTPATP